MFGVYSTQQCDYKYCDAVGGDPYEILKLHFGRQYTKNEVESAYRRAALEVHSDKRKEKDNVAFHRLGKAKELLLANWNSSMGTEYRKYYAKRMQRQTFAERRKYIQETLKKSNVTWAPTTFQSKAPSRAAEAAPTEERKVAPEEPRMAPGNAATPTESLIVREKEKQATRIQKENMAPEPDGKPPASPETKKREKEEKVEALALKLEKVTTGLEAMLSEVNVIRKDFLELEAEYADEKTHPGCPERG